MKGIPDIKLYGAERCHKTQYKILLDEFRLSYQFLNVEQNKDHAEELRGLYESKKFNFPTITIGKKKLRNPYKKELEKWIVKLIPDSSTHNNDREKMKKVIKTKKPRHY